jgi:hypothetical protein
MKSKTSFNGSAGQPCRLLLPTLFALAILFTGSRALAQFVPGSGGSIPDIAPFTENPGEFGGLYIYKAERENNFFGGGTSAQLEFRFPSPSSLEASGFTLQRFNEGAWEEVANTISAEQDNFSINPWGSFNYRLLALGGPRAGDVSNVVSGPFSAIDTEFSGWGLDESLYISGIMSSWVGRGLTASFSVRKLEDSSPVTGALTLQWYRVNPKTWELISIPGATEATYITTPDDVGGYHLLCRATGDGVNVDGFVQIIAQGGVVIPNRAFVSGVSATGFRLNLFKSVPSLAPSDLRLSFWNGVGDEFIPVTAVTPVGGNATFQIAAAIPEGVTTLTLVNESDVWLMGEEMMPGHLIQQVTINVPAGGYVPKISVQQPSGKNLTDGRSTVSFGTVVVRKKSAVKTFRIINTGSAPLTGIAVAKSGAHSRDFVVTRASRSQLAPGESATFKVTFKPGAKGARKADLRIRSNDVGRNPFDIKLTGRGK